VQAGTVEGDSHEGSVLLSLVTVVEVLQRIVDLVGGLLQVLLEGCITVAGWSRLGPLRR